MAIIKGNSFNDGGMPFHKFNHRYLPDWVIPRWIRARQAYNLPIPKELLQPKQQDLF